MTTLGELGLRLEESVLAFSGWPLPAIAERALSAEVARGPTGYFSPVAHTPGFAEAARRVRELRQEAVDPKDLARHHDALESEAKAQDIVSLHRRHQDARAGFYDSVDALAAADPGSFPSSVEWPLRHLPRRTGDPDGRGSSSPRLNPNPA